MNMRHILLEHINRYKNMEIQDAVKLIYQSVFGCAHLIEDQDICEKRIAEELEKYSTIPERTAYEDIGGGYARLYLNSQAAKLLPSEFIADMFIETSKHNEGSVEIFETSMNELRTLVEDGNTPFSLESFEKYAAEYKKSGYPVVSHSGQYNKLYCPSYRVILKIYEKIHPLLIKISEVLSKKSRCVVALDGRSASGKTTLAEIMRNTFDADVIHMDDFFLPAELRTSDRFIEPGGNVHYERFNEEVVYGLNSGDQFEYQVFDCSEMRIKGKRKVGKSKIIIVEGAYALHPKITAQYDVKAFYDIDKNQQLRRIIKRNGKTMLENFENRWIPLENEYIKAYSIKEKCSVVLKN